MKYKRIYQTLEKNGAKISYDNSGWRHAGRFQTYIDRIRPLWIVAEAEKQGLRLWVTHDAGRLTVTTANLSLPIDSREYHQSQTCCEFRTQGELADYLKALLNNAASDVA